MSSTEGVLNQNAFGSANVVNRIESMTTDEDSFDE